MHRRHIRLIPIVTILLFSAIAVGQGTKITPPKNSYSPADDVKLGREAAQQVEKELPVMRDEQINDYLSAIGRRLAENIPPEFRHQEFIGQTVEAKRANARRLVAPRKRQQSGDPRHGAVKRSVKARHLRHCRTALAKCFY